MKTDIEYVDETLPIALGCKRLGDGCTNCYAITTAHIRAGNPNEKIADRYQGLTHRVVVDGVERTDWTGVVRTFPEQLQVPFRWRKPRRVFVNSQSDIGHPAIPVRFLVEVFAMMANTPQHTYLLLTKRPDVLAARLRDPEFREGVRWHMFLDRPRPAPGDTSWWPLPNVQIGVSVENQPTADERIPKLLQIPAAVRWISAEPLLAPVDLDQPRCDAHDRDEVVVDAGGREWCSDCSADGFSGELSYGHWLDPENGGLQWVVVGGESGPKARPMHPQWARGLRDQCAEYGVPFFLKQWGEWGPAPWRTERAPGESVDDYKVRAEATCATHAYAVWAHRYEWNIHRPTHKPWSVERTSLDEREQAPMRRWGKKAAGHLLDGVEHLAYPEAPCD